MMMKLKVHVTEKHIAMGKRCDPHRCPIAIALNEQHPRESGWTVHPTVAYVGHIAPIPPVTVRLWVLPPEAREFTKVFDSPFYGRVHPFADRKQRSHRLEPFEFEMETKDGAEVNSAATGR